MKYFRNILIIFVASVINCQFVSEVYGVANIEANSDVLVGDARKDGIKIFEFMLINSGDSDLVINNIKKSCGCTQTILEKNLIKPGETSTLKIVYTHDGNSNTYSSSVIVESNAKNNPAKLLKINGNIYADPVYFLPQKLLLSGVAETRCKISGSIEIKSREAQDIHVISCSVGDIILKENKAATNPFYCSIQKGAKNKIVVDVNRDSLKTGEYPAILYLDVKVDDVFRKYELPLLLKISPQITFYPESLNLKIEKATTQFQHRIAVKANTGKSIEIKSIICPVEWIKISCKKIDDMALFLYMTTDVPKNVTFPLEVPLKISAELDSEKLDLKYHITVNRYE